MKRLISAAKGLIAGTLALSLLGATAASAAPVDRGIPIQYRDNGYRHRGDDNGAAIAAGVGFLALMAILASQHRDHDGWSDRGYDRGDWGRDRGYNNDRGYGGYGGYDRGNGGYDNGYGYRGR
jgi:hypothetical protein